MHMKVVCPPRPPLPRGRTRSTRRTVSLRSCAARSRGVRRANVPLCPTFRERPHYFGRAMRRHPAHGVTNVTRRIAALRWLAEAGQLPADARQSLELRVEDAVLTWCDANRRRQSTRTTRPPRQPEEAAWPLPTPPTAGAWPRRDGARLGAPRPPGDPRGPGPRRLPPPTQGRCGNGS